MGYHPNTLFLGSLEKLEILSNGCQIHFLEWRHEREYFYVPTRRIYCEGPGTQSMQACEILVWPQESTASLVQEVN